MSETIAAIVAAHRAGRLTPEETIRRTFARIRAHDDPGVFIALRPEMEAVAEACLVAARVADLPLLGVPVAVKDNIDVEGLPTTAACPAFAYEPREDAQVVARLKRAGAIVIGKTNLDQFSLGFSGTRTPHPVPRNPLDARLIPGGSSAGSAVAVAAGLVPLALGTDTAGGGRVPAALNNIIGLKPSLDLVSTAGVVPACRALDCVSLFALTVDDAWTALTAVADQADPTVRRRALGSPGPMPRGLRFGVPRAAQRVFFGDAAAAGAYETALARLGALGATVVEIDFEPFARAARLLREGPWIAERFLAARALVESAPQSLHATTREVVLGGSRRSAVDAFAALHEAEELRQACEVSFRAVDALALPAVPTACTLEQLRADPLEFDARLGTYGGFANLLDLCALVVPASLPKGSAPFGIMLLAPGGRDSLLASIGRLFHANTGLGLGALNIPHPPLAALPVPVAADEIAVALVGGHVSGLPLDAEMRARGARFMERTTTRPDYRLFALAGEPTEPALVRAGAGKGRAIEVDIWALPANRFGPFVAAVAAPLSVGKLTLADGRTVEGVLVDSSIVEDAPDISRFGSWKAYLAARAEAGAAGDPAVRLRRRARAAAKKRGGAKKRKSAAQGKRAKAKAKGTGTSAAGIKARPRRAGGPKPSSVDERPAKN